MIYKSLGPEVLASLLWEPARMDGMKRMVYSVRIDRARVVPVWVLFPL